MKKFLSASWPGWAAGILLGCIMVLWRAGFSDENITEYAGELYEWAAGGGVPGLSAAVFLLAGLAAGGAAASFTGNRFRIQLLEEGSSLSDKFGRSILWAGGGGFLLMLGSLIAGDIPWEQFALAGQMSRPAWIFLAGTVISGVFLAIMLGGKISAAGDDTQGKGKDTGKSRGGRS